MRQYEEPEGEYDPISVHELQKFVPPREYVEGKHASHALLVAEAKFPAMQSVHSVRPDVSLTNPSEESQSTQDAEPEEIADTFPIGQSMHESALDPLYFPPAHSKQTAAFT